jgi:hypothetical protein
MGLQERGNYFKSFFFGLPKMKRVAFLTASIDVTVHTVHSIHAYIFFLPSASRSVSRTESGSDSKTLSGSQERISFQSPFITSTISLKIATERVVHTIQLVAASNLPFSHLKIYFENR